MKALKVTGCLAMIWLSQAGFCLDKDQVVDNLIKHYQPDTLIGVEVFEPSKSKMLFQMNPHATFHPASNTKLFTSFVALKELGADYKFKTYLQYIPSKIKNTYKDDVAIHFEGDPSLTYDDYHKMILALKNAGIKTIEGDFILDDYAFPKPYYAPGWTWDDFTWGYAPPITGFSFEKNALAFKLQPGSHLGDKAKVTTKTKLPYPIDIDADITMVTTSEAEDCAFDIEQNANHFSFKGCWPLKRFPSTLYVANQDIKAFMPILITSLLKQEGIKLKGKIRYGQSNLPTQLTLESAPLIEMIEKVLQDSDNFYAESILKALGYQQTGIGSFHEGIKVVNKVLKDTAGIDTGTLALYDGSGLSQYNLVSTHHLTRLLHVAYHDDNFKIFKQALSLSGMDGTLAPRLKTFDTVGKLSAKTGTLKGHSALSGYLVNEQGREVIISILLNHSVDNRGRLKAFEDQLVLAIQSELKS